MYSPVQAQPLQQEETNMSQPQYTQEGLLILTDEQEEQLLQQMEAVIKLMQGKITLKAAQPALGEIVYQDNNTVSFKSLTIPFKTEYADNKIYSKLEISVGMTEEQFKINPDSIDQYLSQATFRFSKINGISREKLVQRLALLYEEYMGFIYNPTAYHQRVTYQYRYQLPKNRKTPYKTYISVNFWDEGKLTRTDSKGNRYFEGATQLDSFGVYRDRF